METGDGNAPTFEKRAIFLGVSASKTYEFDDAYTVAIIDEYHSKLNTRRLDLPWAGDVNSGTNKKMLICTTLKQIMCFRWLALK